MSEMFARKQIAMHGRSLFERGYSCGSSGNLSVRLDDGLLITPTNTCLGRINPERIAKISWDGTLLAGDKPSKEAFLHLAWYRSRPEDRAVVHLHSTYSVAVSCLANIDPSDVLPPITAYYVMRITRLPLVPYYAPGDQRLADEVEQCARRSRAVLLANHGPVVGGSSLEAAVFTAEEIEETAKLFLLLRDENVRHLTQKQCDDLHKRYSA